MYTNLDINEKNKSGKHISSEPPSDSLQMTQDQKIASGELLCMTAVWIIAVALLTTFQRHYLGLSPWMIGVPTAVISFLMVSNARASGTPEIRLPHLILYSIWLSTMAAAPAAINAGFFSGSIFMEDKYLHQGSAALIGMWVWPSVLIVRIVLRRLHSGLVGVAESIGQYRPQEGDSEEQE